MLSAIVISPNGIRKTIDIRYNAELACWKKMWV